MAKKHAPKTPAQAQTAHGEAPVGTDAHDRPSRKRGSLDSLLDRSIENDLGAAADRQSRIERELAQVQHSPRVWLWAVRIAFAVVFIVNVQCALVFAFDPGSYAGAYQLEGPAGNAAVAGLGVAFLMWNATYPLFIWQPERFRVLGWIIMAQQAIGLVGECAIYLGLPAGFELLASSIMAFAAFDGFGLAVMAATFLPYLWVSRE
ncbi:hypothetical protein [Xiamenia xianingshaonis]|uniref:hypothetical protein n=1 Tax=Xiamenia xianingshaonis TaxID=2682776 RepID=UPI0021BD9F6D|nr:hypothetical protein [Xiamenia xianingshaonis]